MFALSLIDIEARQVIIGIAKIKICIKKDRTNVNHAYTILHTKYKRYMIATMSIFLDLGLKGKWSNRTETYLSRLGYSNVHTQWVAFSNDISIGH